MEFGGTANPTWTDERALTAQNAPPADTVVTLRLLNSAGNELKATLSPSPPASGATTECPAASLWR